MQEYAGSTKVQTFWEIPPANWANCYIGLANFAVDRWDWHTVKNTGVANFSSCETHVSAGGDFYVVIVMLGTGSCELESIIAGGSLVVGPGINTDLNLDPAQNIAPLTVNFQALGKVLGGTRTGFDWDFDNDGIPEITGDPVGEQQYTYTEPGSYTCKVTMHADDGNSGTGTRSFHAVNPANNPPSADLTGDPGSGDAPLPVHLDAGGSTDDDTIELYEWDVDGDGEYEFARPEAQLDFTFMRAGTTTVTLRVTDSDFATDTASIPIQLNSGWHVTVVDPDVSFYAGIDLAVQSSGATSHPCVAYADYNLHEMRFARATTADGQTWSAPVKPVDPALDVVG